MTMMGGDSVNSAPQGSEGQPSRLVHVPLNMGLKLGLWILELGCL